MSTYVELLVDNKAIFSYRNEVNPEIFQLFSIENLHRLTGEEATRKAVELNLNYQEDDLYNEDYPLLVLEADARTIRQRLKVLGFSLARVKEAWGEHVQSLIESQERSLNSSESKIGRKDYEEEYKEEIRKHLNYLRSLDFDVWLNLLKELVSKEDANISHTRFEKDSPFYILEGLEEGLVLTAILHLSEDGSRLVLNLTELEVAGWLDSDTLKLGDFKDIVFQQYSPPIIITEGIYDRRILIETLSLLHPHLSDYIKFLNTDEYKPEGGVGSVVKMVKSFISAGIANRVLIVFDNDTAAKEALSSLRGVKIPPHFKFIHYPALKSLESYPTIGPHGIAEMDINGLAGSLELYLGKDILVESDGSRIPIQWTGYSERMGKYQGEILKKQSVQQLFDKKLKIAKKDPSMIKHQDWTGIEGIWINIIDELSSL